jgi:hypothetical protein
MTVRHFGSEKPRKFERGLKLKLKNDLVQTIIIIIIKLDLSALQCNA